MAREPLVIGPFAGGLNAYDDPTSVRDNELVEALNWDPGLEGSLRSRPPFQDLGKPVTLGATGNLKFLGFFYGTQNSVYLIASDGLSSTWSYHNGTWTLITSTFSASAMAQFNNQAWLLSPVGETDPGGYWTPAGGFVADANMPRGDTIISFKSRLWLSPGKGNPQGTRLYYSKVLGQPDFWLTPSFVDVGQGDGQDIVLLSTYYNTLVAFRTQSIYAFAYNNDPAQGAVTLLVPGVGLTSKECLVVHENYLYFMYDEKAYQFINNNAQQINMKVPFTASNKADSSLPFSVSLFNNRVIYHYYDTMYVFSLRTKTWTRWRSPEHGSIGQIMSPSGVLTDEAFVNPSAVVPAARVRRNLHPNPWPTNGSVRGWEERWGFTRSWASSWMEFTCPSSQDSVGRGWDMGGNYDISPSNTAPWTLFPVTAGQPVLVQLKIKSTVALWVRIGGRVHNGSSWLGAQSMGSPTFVPADTETSLSFEFTPSASGYVSLGVRAESGVTIPAGAKISGGQVRIEPGGLTSESYFDGGWAGWVPGAICSYEGDPSDSPSRAVESRTSKLLYITDGFSNVSENFTCEIRTKNYNYQLSSNFKRLFWWGIDAAFRSRVRGWAVPVVHQAQVSWGQLWSQGVTWGDLLQGTWGSPFIGDMSEHTDYDLTDTGPMRKFIKMFKSLRFRQIYFRVVFDTDGSIGTAPVNLFTITAYVGTKETVSKTVS